MARRSLLCYLSYGNITSGSITAELTHRSNNPVISFLNLTIASAVMLTYPIQAFAAVEVLERGTGLRRESGVGQHATSPDKDGVLGSPDEASRWCRQLVFRSVLVLFTAFVATSVSSLGLIVSLFGSLNGSIIALVFPPLADLRLGLLKMSLTQQFFNAATLVFGVIGCLMGTTVALAHIVAGDTSGGE